MKKLLIISGYAVGLCVLLGLAAGAQEASVDKARSALERWIETEQAIAKQRQEWAVGKEMLQDRVDLLQSEIESYRTKIKEAQASIGEADKKRGELISENDALKALGDTLTTMVVDFEGRVKQLNARLPEPLADLVKPLSQRLPDDPNDTKLSLGLRFQNVVGILDSVTKFNRDIKVFSELRDLPNGQTAEVTAMYIGLGQAYYTGSNGTIAGMGRPSDAGWQWEPADEVAGRISDSVSILKNEKVASFVPLPVKVQ